MARTKKVLSLYARMEWDAGLDCYITYCSGFIGYGLTEDDSIADLRSFFSLPIHFDVDYPADRAIADRKPETLIDYNAWGSI